MASFTATAYMRELPVHFVLTNPPYIVRYRDRQGRFAAAQNHGPSNRDPLDFIERNLIARAIVQLRCARAFMRRDRLRVFNREWVASLPEFKAKAQRSDDSIC
jgi:hypothetical protein